MTYEQKIDKRDYTEFNWVTDTGLTAYATITEIDSTEDNPIIYCRYTTPSTEGLYNPLVRIDTTRKMVYFLTERSFNGDIDIAEFTTRGTKINIY